MVPGKHVLYFALQPSPEAAAEALARLEAARREYRLAGKPSLPARLHVSLNFVGDFKRPPGPIIAKAAEVAKEVVAHPFTVAFNRLGSWGLSGEEGPIVLWGDDGVIGVNALYSTIHHTLMKAGMVPRREAEMTPHMTLTRDKINVAEAFVDPVTWPVEEFVLIHAVHGEGRHEVVERYPLTGRG